MKQKLIINSEEVQRRCLEIVKAIPIDPCHEVIIREHKKDRSSEQNSLYWKRLTVIGNSLGESKEALHERFKSDYLVNIYERDNPEYAEMLETLRNVYREGMRDEALNLRVKIVSLTSTTTATVSQMSEYMTCIDRKAAELGIRLPSLED